MAIGRCSPVPVNSSKIKGGVNKHIPRRGCPNPREQTDFISKLESTLLRVVHEECYTQALPAGHL